MSSIVHGTVVAGRAVPRAPSRRRRAAAEVSRPSRHARRPV